MVKIQQGDRQAPLEGGGGKLPAVIVLDRLRSAFNVGNVFRLADAVSAREVITCGYTATPPHPKVAKTARGTDSFIPCRHFAAAAEALTTLKSEGYHIYGIETAVAASGLWEMEVSFPAAFVFGNEALGISAAALGLCDEIIALPALGLKNSINVGNCVAVVLFDALRQHLKRKAAFGCNQT